MLDLILLLLNWLFPCPAGAFLFYFVVILVIGFVALIIIVLIAYAIIALVKRMLY